jgi:ABC-type Fe3+-hydroxamate transport system substrate-binding protein
VTGDSARARAVVDSVTRTLERVRAATAPLPRPTVFWHVWDAPLITIGGGSFMNELVEIAGGRNIYGDLPAVSPQVSFEDLVRRDPDLMLAGPEGAAKLRADPAWRAVRAVREGRVLVVDTALVGRPGVRLGEAAVSLARLIHPGVLPDE